MKKKVMMMKKKVMMIMMMMMNIVKVTVCGVVGGFFWESWVWGI